MPDRLAGYSYLTADLSNAPSGRALALYQHGFGVEFGDSPQAIVLAADGDVYRRLDAAEDRGGPATQGDPGPMLLSPDGLSVALGEHTTRDPRLGVVDLRTGVVTDHRLPGARSVIPLAWSPTEDQVAYLANDKPTNPYSGSGLEGALFVLDLRSGDSRPVPGVGQTRAAAFSPDGRLLAVQQQSGLVVVDLSTGTSHTPPRAGVLAGPAAWSPDGSLLALAGSPGLIFVDPAAAARAEPAAELALDEPDRQQLLGWTGQREVAVFTPSGDVVRVVSFPLDARAPRELTEIGNQGSFGVLRMQLASSLLPDIAVRDAGRPDRGPLPSGFRVALAVVVGLTVAAATAAVLHLLRRRRTARTTATAPAATVRASETAAT
jgi:dipeptidyl aminopeptidase/acylaminoacyl peptidase